MIMKKIYTMIFLLSFTLSGFCQFNQATNSSMGLRGSGNAIVPSEIQDSPSFPDGANCTQNSFWAVGGGQLVSFSLNDNTVTNNGNVMPFPGAGIAYCNNLNGGSYTPTFYSNSSYTKADYYNGSGWTTCNTPPTGWVLNAGGYGNNLYYTSHDSANFRELGIVKYTNAAFTRLYTLPDTSRAITVADLAVDVDGNVWFFTGVSSTFMTDTLNFMSPSGIILKKYPFSFNTYNGYGLFMLNGILYIGLGPTNPIHANTLIPVTITNNTAVAGTPITMPAITFGDLASCVPGSPLAVGEHPGVRNLRISPNPAKDQLHIEFPDKMNGHEIIRIFNSLGVLVYQQARSGDRETITISSFPTGIYYIQAGDYFVKFIRE
jgi:hypothetical protein